MARWSGMGVNEPDLAIVTGVNPVYGEWHPHLELPAAHEAVEVGLVAGPVLRDVDHVTDYSRPLPGGHERRYVGLKDVLEAAALAHHRAGVVCLLESLLAAGESWYLFVHGELDPCVPQPEMWFSGHVYADPLNGAFTVFEVPAGELDGYSPLFAACDRVAGLSAPAESLGEILARLSLAAAVPTGQRYRFGSPFQPGDTSALRRVLEHGRLFFEETDNGTRLRLIAATRGRAALRERLDAAIDRSRSGRPARG